MTELTPVRLNGSPGSTGEPFDIPGGSVPVSIVSLHREPSRAFSLLVTFPRGWDRPMLGHYTCAEDVVFLAGRLRIGDETFVAGDWAHMPAGYLRAGMHADTEVVAVARFSGPARWIEGHGESSPPLIRRNLSQVLDAIDGPIGCGSAQLLRHGEPDSSWLVVTPPPAGELCPVEAQIVDLVEQTWHHVPAGAPIPPLSGRAFCWAFDA